MLALAVLQRVKAREMLPNNLGCRIALDPLRTRIPGNHAAVRIQHQQRVILDGVYNKSEMLAAGGGDGLSLAAQGDVQGYSQEAINGSGRVSRSRNHQQNSKVAAILVDVGPLALLMQSCARAMHKYVKALNRVTGFLREFESAGDNLRLQMNEGRCMLAHHLVGLVAKQVFSSGIENCD